MSTDAVSSTTSGFFTNASTSSTSNSNLGYDDFLTLLSAELKYQDPTDPVSSSDQISQMAQLGSLSAMNNIYAASSNAAAFGMIGKEVTYAVTDSSGTTSYYSGTVDSVASSNGKTYLVVGGAAVDLSSVVAVADASKSTLGTVTTGANSDNNSTNTYSAVNFSITNSMPAGNYSVAVSKSDGTYTFTMTNTATGTSYTGTSTSATGTVTFSDSSGNTVATLTTPSTTGYVSGDNFTFSVTTA